jgi:hypothetical protein
MKTLASCFALAAGMVLTNCTTVEQVPVPVQTTQTTTETVRTRPATYMSPAPVMSTTTETTTLR